MASKTLYIAIVVVVILLAAVAALLLMGGGQQPPTQTTTVQPTQTTSQKVFKLGALLPLTGGFSSYAKLAQCAAQLAIDDLNAEYGSKGIKFELYVEDTQLDPNIALQKLQSLYARGVRAVHERPPRQVLAGRRLLRHLLPPGVVDVDRVNAYLPRPAIRRGELGHLVHLKGVLYGWRYYHRGAGDIRVEEQVVIL